MKIVNFKRALFLENDFKYEDGDFMERLKHDLEKEGVTCDFIGNAFRNKEEIAREIDCYDAIIFASTFLYPDQIRPIAKLLEIAQPKTVIIFNCSGYELGYILNKTWSIEELAKFDHHKVYQLIYPAPEEDDWLEEFTMLQYREAIEEAKKNMVEKFKKIPLTGRQILIRILQAQGKQFKNLKEGDIVPELEYGIDDPKPGRGVWVMGVEEPVKLVNDNYMDEWEYHEPNARALAIWIGKMTGDIKKVDPEILYALEDWIINYSSPLKSTTSEIWFKITEILDSLGLPRRHYRNLINDRILEYGKKHTYFKE